VDSNKYIRIDSRYRLAGWLGQPHALVDSLTAQAHFVPKTIFDTLRMCNGRFRPSDPVFLGPRRTYLDLFDREGVLTFSDEPVRLESEQEYRLYPNHYMREVLWSLTGRCNYRCRHCYMHAPRAALPQPTTDECLRIADQMAEAGIQVVKLTGGECLIRSDFLQIVDRLLAGGVQIATILTNGALLTEELLCALEERGVVCGFDISFDGAGGWHDWLRGVTGAESAAVRAFELCREHGFPTGAQLVLHRGNVGVLRESVRLLGELGVGSLVVGGVDDKGEAHNMADQLLGYDELFDVYCSYVPQFLEDGSPVASISLDGIFVVQDGQVILVQGDDHGEDYCSSPACGQIRSSLYLGPDGAILPCIPMTYEGKVRNGFPNVAHTTIAEALTDSSYWDLVSATAGEVLERNPACRECSYRTRCLGGCRAKGVDESGNADVMGSDPQMCRYYQGGYYDRARALVERYKS
jgi:radical SAM protein with 4Fe4S-binding SPASM domain